MNGEHDDTGQEAVTVGGRRRTVQVKFRVTEDERALIAEKMRLLHTDNLAAYMRKMAIDGYIIKTDHTDIKAMTAEIQRVGVNVNQIAKKINTYGSGGVYAEDMAKIQEVLSEIWQSQRFILSKAH
jgi:alkyl hydroperoxide reductase subunit AhpC